MGRPFLATAGAVIDVKDAKLTLQFGEEKVSFDMRHPTHLPHCPDQCFTIDVIDECVTETYLSSEDVSALEDEKSILYNEHTSIDPSPVALIDSSQEASLTYDLIPSAAPKVDLKPLPEHLRYEFLGYDNTYPVIVSSRLTPMEIDRLLEIIRRYRAVIG